MGENFSLKTYWVIFSLRSLLTWRQGEIRRDKNETYAQNNEPLSER